jgi:hypothetical protein
MAAAAAAAIILGSVLQVVNLTSLAEPAAILRVGADSSVREPIEEALGEIPVTLGVGHDGQYFFATALDPFARDERWVGTYETYRHRRVAYPLIAGLGGWLSPEATLFGMAVVPILGLGLAAAASVALAPDRWRNVALAAVLASPGLWMSLSLATADTLALGAGLAGLWLVRRRRLGPAIVWFVIAALTKETHLLFAASAAAWFMIGGRRWRDAMLVGGVPTVVLIAWMQYLSGRIPSDGVGLWNFDWPLAGLLEAVDGWSGGSAILVVSAILGTVIAVVGAARTRSLLLRLTLVPWILVALVTAEVVWRDGNNVARVLAPLLTIGVLAFVAGSDDVGDTERAEEDPATSTP